MKTPQTSTCCCARGERQKRGPEGWAEKTPLLPVRHYREPHAWILPLPHYLDLFIPNSLVEAQPDYASQACCQTRRKEAEDYYWRNRGRATPAHGLFRKRLCHSCCYARREETLLLTQGGAVPQGSALPLFPFSETANWGRVLTPPSELGDLLPTHVAGQGPAKRQWGTIPGADYYLTCLPLQMVGWLRGPGACLPSSRHGNRRGTQTDLACPQAGGRRKLLSSSPAQHAPCQWEGDCPPCVPASVRHFPIPKHVYRFPPVPRRRGCLTSLLRKRRRRKRFLPSVPCERLGIPGP